MKTVLHSKGLNDLDQLATVLLRLGNGHRIYAFSGEMGAGKTTFIKSICSALGVKETTSSPTFALVNEYEAVPDKKIFHFDFYRIKNEEEVFDLGYEDYFYSGNYCFIEWPEKITGLLPQEIVQVDIQVENGSRSITIQTPSNGQHT